MNSLANLLLIGLSLINGSFLTNQFSQNLQKFFIDSLTSYQRPAQYENINSLTNITPSGYPHITSADKTFDFKAVSAIAYDVDSGQILAKKDSDKRLPIASLTKIITALVILRDHSLDEEVTIPEGIKLSPDDQKLGVVSGQKFKLDQALQATLIYSANDMAQALAIWDSGSIEKFADKMNRYAKSWGLDNSHFMNADGTDEAEHYSSAKDLSTASLILLNNKKLTSIVDSQKAVISSTKNKTYNVTNTNRLLTTSYIHGIKTGFTANAGQSLATYSTKDNHRIITVLLNSPDRFKETNNLINFVNLNYEWQE